MEQVEPVNDTLLLTEWQALIRQTSPEVHMLLTSLSDEEIRHLVTVFYDYMLSHAESALFLNTEQVSTSLSGSMFDWLRSVLGSAHEDLPQLLAKQREIGVVHARIGLPIDLVNRGARKLKDELYRVLKTKADDSSSLLSNAICFSSLAMDTALEAMTVSYSPSHQNSLHTQEQYRLQTIYDDVNVERERQIRSFTDWENQFIYNIAIGMPFGEMVFLANSDFGMWFSHKGKHILGNSNLLKEMESLIAEIDNRMTTTFSHQHQPTEPERMSLLQDVRQLSAKIHFLLASMFDALVKQENGKDSLTQLLNRRFIPTIMRREISLALHARKPFTLAMLDIDYFKQINDNYGHNTGDMTLKNVAAVIYDHIRSSDYVFRYGGEEFMILLVESDKSQASIILETLRMKIAGMCMAASAAESFSITVSIGIAEYDYHPDYKQLVDKADRALYLAKSNGRDRIEVYQE
ncbi:diguanylate cyclase [Citrobacter portucalensis]|uniref:Diguanylate cyclase DosC n=1 Tax=Citrobacter portucalensis TaxID=1639133 RepID=A0AAW5VYP7_9ENTR|nr:diguanylate cyclase [Citrobacter portucalensis]MCX9000760.1 diguanylate cyclase [Citrobacter portucalensis]